MTEPLQRHRRRHGRADALAVDQGDGGGRAHHRRQLPTDSAGVGEHDHAVERRHHRDDARHGGDDRSLCLDRAHRGDEHVDAALARLAGSFDRRPRTRVGGGDQLGQVRRARQVEPRGEIAAGRVELGDERPLAGRPGGGERDGRGGRALPDHGDEAHLGTPPWSTPPVTGIHR
ncbi:MAG: hypothetical protein QM733_01905 [Ilumatobacteraceae bacterium]